jgi:hypothetical protein
MDLEDAHALVIGISAYRRVRPASRASSRSSAASAGSRCATRRGIASLPEPLSP